jgi:dolichyl-phosphate-mannose-protein mannosyltransferase
VQDLLRRLNRPVVAVLAVAIIAGGIRFLHLSSPSDYVFDEIYYPKVACIYAGWSDQTCTINSNDEKYWRTNKWDVGSWVHPPLGKWMIAMGIKLFGMDSFGWRFMSALEGTLICVMVALIAQLLFGSALWTFVAGVLMAVENLNVVMSRVGLLDIHLEFWIVLGFLFLLLDRRWIDRHTPPDPEPVEMISAEGDVTVVTPRRPATPSPLWRPWRFAAGAALGASCAVKWDGVTALAAAVFLAYVWETTRRRRDDVSRGRAFVRAFTMETFGLILAFLLVPAVVYLVTWIPWFHHFGWSLSAFWQDHLDMWRYHAGLKETALDPQTHQYTPTHPYYARPWKWLPMVRPVSFYVKNVGGDIRQILAIGNPAIFWGSIWALPWVAWSWWHKRDWRCGFILVPFLFQYLPWFAVSRPQFFFYVLPCTPFMVLACVYALRDLSDARVVQYDHVTGMVAIDPETGAPAVSRLHPFRPVAWVLVIAAVALFVWFWPVLTGGQISHDHWRLIVWFPGWA